MFLELVKGRKLKLKGVKMDEEQRRVITRKALRREWGGGQQEKGKSKN